jgi:hypothetical protein
LEIVVGFVESYGYWMLLAAGFAEFAGFPIVTVPILIAAGSIA